MRIPYVIDNQANKLGDVLNGILAEHAQSSLDVASACVKEGVVVNDITLIRSCIGSMG
jgi:hypothetical protein